MPRLVSPVLPADVLSGKEQPTLPAEAGILLRPWLAEDVAALVTAYGDPEIRHWHHRSMSRQEGARWIVETGERWSAETGAEWAVLRDGEVAGRVGLNIARALGLAEISYWTLPEARGTGLARRAVRRVAGWALDEIGFWRLELRHSTRNLPSCRVATSAGFRFEAELTRCHIHDDGWHDIHVHTRFRDGAAG